MAIKALWYRPSLELKVRVYQGQEVIGNAASQLREFRGQRLA